MESNRKPATYSGYESELPSGSTSQSNKGERNMDEYVKRDEVEAEYVKRDEVEALVKNLLKKERWACNDFNTINPPGTRKLGALDESTTSQTVMDPEELMNIVDLRLSAREAEEEEWHSPFGESIYTLLYMCECQSQGFLYGVCIYGIQIATITLTMADVVVVENSVPAMVSMTVTFAQAIIIFVLLAYMSDLIEAVLKLQDGFYPEVLEVHPGATYATWLISCLAQLMAGLLLLVASFVLIMQSGTVIDLILNCTALLFLAEIDDIGFAMAGMGFVTDVLQRQAEAVSDFKVPKRNRSNINRRVLYLISLIGLYVGYGIIKDDQMSGRYLSTNIYVQFGDSYNKNIPYFSGILTSGSVRTLHRREYRDLGTEKILLAYCRSERAWTFSEVDDPCYYFAKSFQTDAFDVTTLHDSEWQVLDTHGRLQPFDSFSLVSRDCNKATCQGNCDSDGLCQCPHDRFGMDCEFPEVCQNLELDERFAAFPPVFLDGRRAVGHKFWLLQNNATKEYVQAYNMPVYYSDSAFPANIIFFGGRRWILTSEYDLLKNQEAAEQSPWFFPEKTVAALEKGFHAYHQANYTPFFLSDPVDFETPDFQATPIGLKWWTVQKGNGLREYAPDRSVESVLVCKEEVQSCLREPDGFCVFGKCNQETGFCDCNRNYKGDQCDLPRPCYESITPCNKHGICDAASGTCRCNNPYFGPACEGTSKCYEEGGRCQNGGVCNELTGECTCPDDPAITGIACEITADCFVFGCANGGVCSWNGACVCRPPFYGAHCDFVNTTQEEHLCTIGNADCGNGTCNLLTGICDCEDPNSYGTNCEHTYNCSDVPSDWGEVTCLNSGTCNHNTGVCDCPKPFYGPDCSQIAPCFSDEDCAGAGGGQCNVTSGLCPCPDVRAEYGRCTTCDCFSDDDCHNGGTCDGENNCQCENGYGGWYCDAIIKPMYNPEWDDHFLQLGENTGRCGFDDPGCERCSADDPPSYCHDP